MKKGTRKGPKHSLDKHPITSEKLQEILLQADIAKDDERLGDDAEAALLKPMAQIRHSFWLVQDRLSPINTARRKAVKSCSELIEALQEVEDEEKKLLDEAVELGDEIRIPGAFIDVEAETLSVRMLRDSLATAMRLKGLAKHIVKSDELKEARHHQATDKGWIDSSSSLFTAFYKAMDLSGKKPTDRKVGHFFELAVPLLTGQTTTIGTVLGELKSWRAAGRREG